VIAQQESFFGKAREELETAMGSYLAKLRAFTNRIAIPQPRSQELERMIRDAHAQVTAQVSSAEEANDVHLDSRDSDDVLARLETLFEGRVGDPMKPDQLEVARKEGKRRVDQGIPPGYKDRDKPDSSGDYLVWKQLLQEASTRQLPVILVTDDRTEDWVRREHGLTLGPRPELCEEISAEAGVPFHLMSTATFLRYAREYLSVSVSAETVDQARELPAHLNDGDRASLGEIHRDGGIAEIAARLQVMRGQIDLAVMELGQMDDMLMNRYDPRTGMAVDGAVRDTVLAHRSDVEKRLHALKDETGRLMAYPQNS
jgi:PIN like domain